MGKENQNKSRKYMWITLGLIVLFLLIVFIINHLNSTRLQRAVWFQRLTHGDSYVTLGELMNFEWDRAVYFRHIHNPRYIADSLGVQLEQIHRVPTDLTIGIAFARNNEIVYYELFPQTWRGIDFVSVRFDIYAGTLRRIYPDDVLEVRSRNRLGMLNEPSDPLRDEALRNELLLEFGYIFELTIRVLNRNRNSVVIRFNDEIPLEDFQNIVERSRIIALNALEASELDSLGITVSLRNEFNEIWQFSSGHNERRSDILEGVLRFCTCESQDYNFSQCWRSDYCFDDRNVNVNEVKKIIQSHVKGQSCSF